MAFYPTTKIRSYRTAAEILELIEAFEHCLLPLSAWTNETYLTLAFWYLYLNSLPEAERLMSASLARYNFENGLNPNPFERFEKTEISALLGAINDFIKLYKSEKSFVVLANLILTRFTDQNLRLKNYRRAQVFFPQAVVKPIIAKESR